MVSFLPVLGGILPHRGMMTSPGNPFPSVVVTSGQNELSYTTVSTVISNFKACPPPFPPKHPPSPTKDSPDSSTPA